VGDPVPATIDADTVWTADGSPWTLDGDVMVYADTTLSVQPGAVVEIAKGASLRVEGTLVARGTAAAPIRFTGMPTGGGTARWGSVVFLDASEDAIFDQVDEYVAGSVLEHCILEQGARAVQTEAASPFLFRAAFQDNAFSPSLAEGGAALYIGPGSAPRVAECTFEDNAVGGSGQGGAIYVDDANPVLQDNLFRGNTSTYGGALTTFAMYAPIVGNTFEDNHSAWEGGAVALVSSSPAFLNNRVVDNDTILDGGGVHVCVTCYPHAFPFVMDNVITGNHNVGHGAAGLGSAHLRVFSHNDIHDNFMGTEPADFAWHNAEFDIAPSWVRDPAIPHNWWGTTDLVAIQETIHDGLDDDEVGRARFLPVAQAPTARPTTRVTITTRKYRYFDDGEQMPVFLTLYNPGPAREVELAVLLQYGDGAPIYYRDDVGFPEADLNGDTWRLELPENAAWYGELMAPAWRDEPAFPYGTWHAALFDPDSGAPIGDLVSARFELGELVE